MVISTNPTKSREVVSAIFVCAHFLNNLCACVINWCEKRTLTLCKLDYLGDSVFTPTHLTGDIQ